MSDVKIEQLLFEKNSDGEYYTIAEIVDICLFDIPKARTTEKSVKYLMTKLRKKGVELPERPQSISYSREYKKLTGKKMSFW